MQHIKVKEKKWVYQWAKVVRMKVYIPGSRGGENELWTLHTKAPLGQRVLPGSAPRTYKFWLQTLLGQTKDYIVTTPGQTNLFSMQLPHDRQILGSLYPWDRHLKSHVGEGGTLIKWNNLLFHSKIEQCVFNIRMYCKLTVLHWNSLWNVYLHHWLPILVISWYAAFSLIALSLEWNLSVVVDSHLFVLWPLVLVAVVLFLWKITCIKQSPVWNSNKK